MVINSEDAKYILSEVRFIPYYEKRIAGLMAKVSELDQMITVSTNPASPNGGVDVIVNGKAMRVKVPGAGRDNDSAIIDLIVAQEPLEQELVDITKRCNQARKYRDALLASSAKDFVADFISRKKSYRELEEQYFVSNAYDRMIRLIMQTIKTL